MLDASAEHFAWICVYLQEETEQINCSRVRPDLDREKGGA